MLLSTLFSLPVHNVAAHPVSIQFGVKAPMDVPGSFQVAFVPGTHHCDEKSTKQMGQEEKKRQ